MHCRCAGVQDISGRSGSLLTRTAKTDSPVAQETRVMQVILVRHGETEYNAQGGCKAILRSR